MGENAVTIAFFYKGTTTKAGTFEIDNVVVKSIEGANKNSNTGDEDDNNEDDGDGDDNNGSNNEGNDGNFANGSFTLVADAAQLTIGDSIIIAYENFAMGAHSDNGKYRTKTDIMTSGDVITDLADDVQIILLEEGITAGTYAFNVGNGYLAASSNSSNNLATTTTLNENGSWTIVINNSLATITAQGTYTRNILQYNTSSPRFSCYTGTQKAVNIYAKSPITTGIEEMDDEGIGQSGTVKGIFDLSGRRLNAITEPGIYIVNGKKVLIK